ncbi:cobyrinate a,c-diamide synthase [Roseomonas elaeocarpi]|uniref:Cobyrinate a,c-diamide synthase n=1 Tax=Roseomonas elaeocarpi TaxID=907779 RepID=A0ABV6JXR5_9PROT
MVAAPRSGSGKTTVMLALLSALRRRGVRVRAAKSGPDYIDGAFHEAATGFSSPNLDSWAMPPPLLRAVAAGAVGGPAAPGAAVPGAFPTAGGDADGSGGALLLAEASMGLFDGLGTEDGRSGSSADVAAALGLPVLLVLDVSGQSQSAAAVARGFATHRPDVAVAGVVLNRVASPRHRDGAVRAMEQAGIAVLGCLGREPAIALPERHLGLVQARELGTLPALLARLAELGESALDLDAILRAARPVAAVAEPGGAALPPPGQRVALASDAAFSFAYPHLLAGWRRLGAEIHPFSPLADEAPPEGCDSCWLPGGYPELHAGRLAASGRFLGGLRDFARDRPVHGECGGYMVLGQAITDAAGERHAMAGLLGHETSFARRRMTLGYREARLLRDGPLGPAGTLLRGHEFHYATESEATGGEARFAALRDGHGKPLGEAGGQRGRVSGSFFHAIARAEP